MRDRERERERERESERERERKRKRGREHDGEVGLRREELFTGSSVTVVAIIVIQ